MSTNSIDTFYAYILSDEAFSIGSPVTVIMNAFYHTREKISVEFYIKRNFDESMAQLIHLFDITLTHLSEYESAHRQHTEDYMIALSKIDAQISTVERNSPEHNSLLLKRASIKSPFRRDSYSHRVMCSSYELQLIMNYTMICKCNFTPEERTKDNAKRVLVSRNISLT